MNETNYFTLLYLYLLIFNAEIRKVHFSYGNDGYTNWFL